MYSTCLFCHSDLGKNEIIEPFPVGRRLAFDAAKGRLWVVCVRCTRWNLTPLEERWEAIEQCERAFRDTKLRVSTDNIGMARMREGLELIRVGRALRPEIVVWRYGTANRARRRRSLVITGVASAAWYGGAYLGLGLTAGPLMPAALWAGSVTSFLIDKGLRGRHRSLRLPHDGQTLIVSRRRAVAAQIVATERDGWALRLDHRKGTVTIADDTRLRRLAMIMASVNDQGVATRNVKEGEELLASAGDPEQLIARFRNSRESQPLPPCPPDQSPYYYYQSPEAGPSSVGLAALSEPVRAALEMAANEEAERRAMEGELAALEESWREAEEIASIADNLLLPPSVTEAMKRLGGGR